MNQKEISEIRRQFKADKSNITGIYTAHVNDKKQVLSCARHSVALMSQDALEEILSILKRSLSGTVGKNLIDISFSTRDVEYSENHKTLMELNGSGLADDEKVKSFMERIAKTVKIEEEFLILLASDTYDVFKYSKNDTENESTTQFKYILCAICPIKLTKQALGFFAYENSFKNVTSSTLVGAPVMGFMFPAFDDRATNIYNALYYTRDTASSNDEFALEVFGKELPLPASAQKEVFGDIMSSEAKAECSYEVVEAFREELCNKIEEHKASRERDTLLIDADDVSSILRSCGASDAVCDAVSQKYAQSFGENASVIPQNLIDVKRLVLENEDVTIKVNPFRSDLVSTKTENGVPYVMVKVENDVCVNGIKVCINEEEI